MAKNLNDTQLTILSNAAARDDRRVLPLPKLKAPAVAVTKTIKSMIADGLLDEIAAGPDDKPWERSETDGSSTLVITGAGLRAIGIEDEPAHAEKSANKRDKRPTRAKKPRKGATVAKRAPRANTGDGGGKTSKQDAVIALLRRPRGATIEEMMEATNWQAHSVRGFMSGALKKRLGLELVSEKDKKTGERRYRITS